MAVWFSTHSSCRFALNFLYSSQNTDNLELLRATSSPQDRCLKHWPLLHREYRREAGTSLSSEMMTAIVRSPVQEHARPLGRFATDFVTTFAPSTAATTTTIAVACRTARLLRALSPASVLRAEISFSKSAWISALEAVLLSSRRGMTRAMKRQITRITDSLSLRFIA